MLKSADADVSREVVLHVISDLAEGWCSVGMGMGIGWGGVVFRHCFYLY